MIRKPQSSEYAPFYETYVSHIDSENVLEILKDQFESIPKFFGRLSDEQAEYKYAPEKWSVKDVLNHVNDAERVFSYRAFCIARGEEQPLPGMDQNVYQDNSNSDMRTMADLIEEFKAIRSATLAFFGHITEQTSLRTGTASDASVSVRALAAIIAGHHRHHLEVINQKYL